jgi:putative FmdB family regulatory protein
MTDMIREFECEECGHEFEDLVGNDEPPPPCPECKSTKTKRVAAKPAHGKHSSWTP